MLAGILLVGMLLLGGCRMQWSWGAELGVGDEYAERPMATSTPMAPQVATPGDASKPGGGLLKTPSRPATATPPQAPVATLDTSLSTEEQLAHVVAPMRDLRELALRINPAVEEIPLVVNETAPDYAVGTQLKFWTHDLVAGRHYSTTAELVYKTGVAYAWVETGQPFDRDAIASAMDRFSARTYPAVRDYFGSEWMPGVDDDPRLHILHATNVGDGIAGYYSSADEYSRLARAYSNEKEIFYINLDWLNRTNDYTEYETVLAHEFQHMIHWYQDRNEETWVNEGLSEFAQEVAGFAPDTGFATSFANAPDTQLNAWGLSSSGNGAHYGSAYLFTAYFVQRFGPEMTRALVAHPANGVRGFHAVLAEAEPALTFEEFFADWVVANYVDDPNALGLAGVYGYRNISQSPPRLDARHDAYPTAVRRTDVRNYAADYVLLENAPAGADAPVLQFQGEETTRLAELDAYSGEYVWWSNRGDDFNTRLTRRFDLRTVEPGTPVEMDVAMWWDIEEDYDFGYVLASEDGETWTTLPGDSTTLGGEMANAFGPGYTGKSDGWRREQFDLSAYAGRQVTVRFEMVTDDAINARGWFIDDVTIPAIDYHADFEQGPAGWVSEGWLYTNNRLAQGWLLQLMILEDARLQEVIRLPVDATGRVAYTLPPLDNGRRAVLAISALAPVTTEPAAYEYRLAAP